MLKATLTLLSGSVLAHALPLALGPVLTRLYSPQDFGQFALLWAVASNLAVVVCARYDFALPLEPRPRRAALLMALCLRIAVAVTALSMPVGLTLWWWQGLEQAWLLPLAVLAAGGVQWLGLWATRGHRFGLLATARLVQQGGAAVMQVLLGLLKLGLWGLWLGPVLAGLAATWLLARPAPQGGWRRLLHQPLRRLQAMAAQHRDFPLYNTPHAFAGALQDTLTLLLIAAWAGDAAAGFWALALRYLKAPATLLGGALSQALYPRLAPADGAAPGCTLAGRALVVDDSRAIREALPAFERQIKGFAMPDAVLTGVETRTSSPLRITRGRNWQSLNVGGLYPAGEGAGYAGGIMSAAVDGIEVAEALATQMLGQAQAGP